ncbi:hypothetical protein [Mumia sp. DW29H23]|uniref:hypothetical protein n=1 Tax=Mumia sp. DW29H23 TaxID=3421241 RepID=UPI003D695DF5
MATVPNPFTRYRARVYSDHRLGRRTWHLEVRDLETGDVVYRDNTGSNVRLHDLGAEVVAHARFAAYAGWLK